MEKPLPRPNALSYGKSAGSRRGGVGSASSCDGAAIVSCLPTRTFRDGPLRGSFRQTYHAYACIGLFLVPGIHRGRQQQRISPQNDGRLKKGSRPGSAPQIALNRAAANSTCCPSTRATRFLTMAHASSVLCGVLVMIAVQIRARQLEYKPQMFRLGSVERFARNSASFVCSIHPRGDSHADGARQTIRSHRYRS